MIQFEGAWKMPAGVRAHCARTARYAAALYAAVQRSDGLSHEELTTCSYLVDHPAILEAHDVGKCFVPKELLVKTARLTDRQMDVMRLHTIWGAVIFGSPGAGEAEARHYAKFLALLHHERWDGKGYPYGFRKSETPFPVALFSVADVYDTITAGRPYQLPKSHQEARRAILMEAGRQFSPVAIAVFKRSAPALEALLNEMEEA